MERLDGRKANELRPVEITTGVNIHAEGSALIKSGQTQVICTATVEDRVPGWLRESGQGWITCEYGMIPRATNARTQRESSRGRPSGRTQEIQRLIGRSLRAVADMKSPGRRTCRTDGDVVQAAGGPGWASIAGACVALAMALGKLRAKNLLGLATLRGLVAAVSVGMVGKMACLDLNYAEDSQAE